MTKTAAVEIVTDAIDSPTLSEPHPMLGTAEPGVLEGRSSVLFKDYRSQVARLRLDQQEPVAWGPVSFGVRALERAGTGCLRETAT